MKELVNEIKTVKEISVVDTNRENESEYTVTENTSQTERIMFPCTLEFKNELEKIAAAQNKSLSELIKSVCITTLKMKSTLPNNSRGRSSKYATAAEREAANKAYRQKRYEDQKAALRMYRESMKK